ncbi:MAG: transglutaminase-like domain-containing protein [Myxococcota bacterium]|nr:transglutaminase-like domain-containing protein [Myxococcota bacterium]
MPPLLLLMLVLQTPPGRLTSPPAAAAPLPVVQTSGWSAATGFRDEAWLRLEVGGRPLGWARERFAVHPGGRLTLSREVLAGEVRERLTASWGPAPEGEAHYRRVGGGDPVEVRLTGGRVAWQVGAVRQEETRPTASVPASLLRSGSFPGVRPVLLEEFGAHAVTVATVLSLPGGGHRLFYQVPGLGEELTLDPRGRLLRFTSAPGGVVARRLPGPPPREIREALGRPLPPLPAAHATGWEEPTPALAAHAARLGQATAVLDFVQRRIRFVSDPAYRSAAEVLARGEADCTGKATLAATLLRLQGHNVRHVVGLRLPRGVRTWEGHQWLELQQADTWLPLDPTGGDVTPATHRPRLRIDRMTPRQLLGAELLLLDLSSSPPTPTPGQPPDE